MNENIFEVLIYLFENYMMDDIGSTSVRADIEDELIRMGFSNYDVGSAFGWLEGLIDQCTPKDAGMSQELTGSLLDDDNELAASGFNFYPPKPETNSGSGHRYYVSAEMQIINIEIRGLLFTLEQNNMINHEVREIIIDRIMALSNDQPLSTDKAKWIVMMVLVNCHGSNNENNHLLDFAESFVFNDVQKH